MRLASITEAKWFAPHVAYTMAKFGMSLCVLGMAEEFRGQGIAVNALGHCHPYLVKALIEQGQKLWHTSNLFRIGNGEKLAKRLVENSFADTMFFCNSGAEAIEMLEASADPEKADEAAAYHKAERRYLGVPARYVSGYLYSDDSEHLASHAWAEAWVDGLWYCFDITNGMSRPQRHLKLAIGLDYLDACPVRGMRRGGGSEQMHARVYVSPHALQTQQ